MAVRLHITFDNTNPVHISAVEQIAQVPAGTYAAVVTYREEAQRLAFEPQAGYEHWAGAQDTPLGALDAFLTFGWGRLTGLARQLAELIGDPEVGSATDPGAVAALLRAQGAEDHARQLAHESGLGVAWH